MNTYTPEQLAEILKAHKLWTTGREGGKRAYLKRAYLKGADLKRAYLEGADLKRAYLEGADLKGACLEGADLERADLEGAYLEGADLKGACLKGAYLKGAYLEGACLEGADLEGADLEGACLDPIREDFEAILATAVPEIPALISALKEGRVNGSTYQDGQCGCLVGTLEIARGGGVGCVVRRDSNRAAERWFLAIRVGDTPRRNPVAEISLKWAEEFLAKNNVVKA